MNGISYDRAAWIGLLGGLLAASLALSVPEPIQEPHEPFEPFEPFLSHLNAATVAALTKGPVCLVFLDIDGAFLQRAELDLTPAGPKLFRVDAGGL